MRLRYTKADGTQMEFQLGEQPITIGRSPDADVVLMDEKISRIHCGIRLWDGEFYVKDLKSRNGTWVNGERLEVCKLKPGDLVRVGSTSFNFELDPEMGQETAIHEIEGQMEMGHGYTTILREIVHDANEKPSAKAAPDTPSGMPVPPSESAEGQKKSGSPRTIVMKRKPATKLTIKRRA